MNLTKAEAEKFWPLYEDYQKALEAVMDRYRTLIDVFAENYQKMTNEKATSLLDKSLDIEAELVRVRTTYVPKFRQALLATKVARYYQIENKIQAVLRYDAATRIPLMTH